MLRSVLISLAIALEVRASVLVPELTGPHKVGTTVLELVDSSRPDPFAPNPHPRDLVVSLFYPTKLQGNNCTLAPQFPPGTAAAVDAIINATQGVAESLTTRSCTDSPMSRPDLPLILLDHGLGTTRLIHSDLAEELASYGWNIVTIDHPYDSVVVEYPDGRLVIDKESPNVANATLDTLLDVRVQDLLFVLDSLSDPSITSRIPGLNGSSSSSPDSYPTRQQKLQTDKVGVFGHSFGGAASLQLLIQDKRFHVGANMDGGLDFGSFAQESTDLPFVFFGRPDHNRHTDKTWETTWANLKGFKREYMVNGTQHGAYTDLPIFRDVLGAQQIGDLVGSLGTIKGTRILAIENAFLRALFDRFLKGRGGELLDGKGLEKWPEVALVQ
ncbi:Alpha/Beta hydrolase protein [Xylaria nigripes]|nr:Alpha/Beta hydrolase protein [Xylaria nigripes]